MGPGMSGGTGGGAKPRSMTRGVMSFGGMTLVSRVFGLVRDQVFNATFGANWMTDWKEMPLCDKYFVRN